MKFKGFLALSVLALFFVMLIGFVCAAKPICLDKNGTTIQGEVKFCEGNNSVTHMCFNDGAYSEKSNICLQGCENVSGKCNEDIEKPSVNHYVNVNGARPANATTEQIKCLFKKSNYVQRCFSEDGQQSCEGTESCLVDAWGYKDSKMNWNSTCEGSGTTIINGDKKSVEFDCGSQIKGNQNAICLFNGSEKEEKCFAPESNYSCYGNGSCSVPVEGYVNKKFIWKSSCGGEAVSVIEKGNENGGNNYVVFYCKDSEKIVTTAYHNFYTLCWNGDEYFKGAADECKTEETWNMSANELCQDKCRGSDQCGVRNFKAFASCGVVTFVKPENSNQIVPMPENTNNESYICRGCGVDNSCYGIGYRNADKYCGYSGELSAQLAIGEKCDLNAACSSNKCDGTCQPGSIYQKISFWFKNIFGR